MSKKKVMDKITNDKIYFVNLDTNMLSLNPVTRKFTKTQKSLNKSKSKKKTKLSKNNIEIFIKDFKDIINIYMTKKELYLNCRKIFDNFSLMLPSQTKKYHEQDANEVLINILNIIFEYINNKLDNNTKIPYNINDCKGNLLCQKVINLTINNGNGYINPLYYLFGILNINIIKKTHKNNSNLNYINDIESLANIDIIYIKDKINYNNIKELLQDNLSAPDKLDLTQQNINKGYDNYTQKNEKLYFGNYVILSLSILQYDITTQQKTKKNLTLDNITSDLDDDYIFFGAIFHHGGSNSGHYTSLVKYNNNYYHYNDTKVTKYDIIDVISTCKDYNPTTLIYKKTKNYVFNSLKYDTIDFFLNNIKHIKNIEKIIDKQRRGNMNNGNTCYFNSVISILLNIPEFVYLMTEYPLLP
jgi:hypothetical protein